MNNGFPDYHIYHPDMPRGLAQGLPTFFIDFVAFNFSIFAGHYKCTVAIDGQRTLQAFDHWRRDTKHTLNEMNEQHGSTGLDHFKTAGFLAYWLRRRLVIQTVNSMANPIPGIPTGYISPLQETFLQHSNELAPFLLGFHYCLRYEYKTSHFNLSTADLPEDFINTVAVLLQQKNVSPHALYLIYKALFLRLDLPSTPSSPK